MTEEIKVFSNKIITNKFNSPTSIQFFDKKKIDGKNGETLSDVLQLAGAVFIKSYGGNASLSTISMNGLGSEHTLILLNGFKISTSQNAQVDLATVSKDKIDRIEVLNNGSSSLYGSEAMGGVINIITKNNYRENLRLYLNGQVGSYGQRKFSVNLSKKLENFNINLSLSKETSVNNYNYYFNNGSEKILKERINSDYDMLNHSAILSYSYSAGNKISFIGNYSKIFRNIPGIEAGSAPSRSNEMHSIMNNVLSFENVFSKGLLFKSQINYQNFLLKYKDGTYINSFYKNIYFCNGSQLMFSKEKFELISGYELSVGTLKSNEVEDNIERIQAGFFLVTMFDVNHSLKIFPSLRYDHISDIKKNVISGKFGLNFKPIDKYSFNLKFSIGNNFASPTFNELYWNDLGNKDLKPESSINLDASAILGFNFLSSNVLEVTYTFIDAKDKILWSPNSNGLWTPKNIGKSKSNVLMVDLNTTKEFYKDIKLSIGLKYSYTQSVKKTRDYEGDPTFDKQIFYIPFELMKCMLSMNYKKTGLNIFYNLTGKRYTDFENVNYLPPVDYIEGNIYQDFKIDKIKFQLKFEVNNILNADYQIISGYPMPLRNYKVNLSLEY